MASGLLWGGRSALGAEAERASVGETKSRAKIPSQVVVDRVELTGVTVFNDAQVEESLEIGPGERYEVSKVMRSAANLQTLYRIHGYEQVRIQTRLFQKRGEHAGSNDALEDVLEFQVQEGDPTRIAEILILSEGLSNLTARSYWESQNATLIHQVGVVSGEILDQEKLSLGKRRLQDLLASREYVGVQAEDVRFETVSPPAGMAKTRAARWVRVEFHVRPGDRVSFGFRGNQVFASTQLLALVEDQRVLGFGKDYVTSIKSRIEEEYKALGYGMVKVRTFTYEKPSQQERHVTYEIQEGPRLYLDAVEFDGNEAFLSSELKTQFYAKASAVIRQGYYSEIEAKKAAELVIEWMKSKGYLSARLVAMNSSTGTSVKAGKIRNSVKLTLYIYEWDQTIVRKVDLKGARAIPMDEIKKTLGVREKDPLNLSAFSEGIEALKVLYRSKGHLDVRIVNEDASDQVIKYFDENRIADIFLDISEGPRYRVGKIILEGLVFTRDYVVQREIPIRENDILGEPKITETEARLRRLGIFSSVSLKLTDDPEREGYKIVRVILQEGTPGVVSGGLGFRNDLGIRVFSGIAYTNLWGENHTLAFDVNANRRLDETYRFGEFQAQVAYVWPWFLNQDLTFRPNLTVSGHEYKLFDATSVSIAATWEKRFLAHLTGTLSYTLERVKQFNATVYQEDNQLMTIGAITPTLRVDYRDNPLAPTRGFYGTASFELAAPWLLSQLEGYPVGYTRFQMRTDYFLPIARELSWYLSFRMGFSRNYEPLQMDPLTGQISPFSGTIPPIKQFTLGGAGSLRGFTEQSLYSAGVTIHGTQSYVNYRTQIDIPVSGNLRFGPFLDAANLQVDTFSLGNLRYGAGVGFHYQTPVGPVNMDVGFNLDPRTDSLGKREPSTVLYFTIGVI